MNRKNIFELLKKKWNTIEELRRIYSLLNTKCIQVSNTKDESVFEFVNNYCFYDWKNRNSYLNAQDMAIDLKINIDKIPSNLSKKSIITHLEFASNIIMLCDNKLFEEENDFKYYPEYRILDENLSMTLEYLNYQLAELRDEEKVIIVKREKT